MFGYDFYYLWAAGKILHERGDPYDPVRFEAMVRAAGWPADEGVQGYLVPPWTGIVFYLFGSIDFSYAYALWIALIVGTILYCGVRIGDLLKLRGYSVTAPFAVLCTLMFPWSLGNLYWGQYNFILLMGVVLYLDADNRGRSLLSGAALALTTFKPHLFIPFYVFSAVRCKIKRDWMCMVGGMLGFLLLVLLSWLISPEAFTSYLSAAALRDGLNLTGASTSQVIRGIFDVSLWPIITLSVSLITAYISLRKHGELFASVRLIIAFSLIASPYMWSHSFLLLLPTFLGVLSVYSGGAPMRAALVALPAYLLIIRSAVDVHFEAYTVVVPYLALAGEWYIARNFEISKARSS